ncbi:MAG: ABC transporter substrate-binding protein [Spirochaetaceae bacterium]|jgi:simple sugar transport system substrate-binding protein|nr:ABC transporter substrate-binding protein [Spirochaetaceae bacterium]
MKKLLVVLMVLIAASFAFAAGGGQQAAGGGSSGGVTRGMDRKIVMGYSQIGAESEWRTACTNSVKAAAEEWNIELIFSDAQQKQENQMQAIRSFIRQKVDIIGFTPVVETGWDAILQEIKDAGIPVICVDRQVTLAAGKRQEDYITAFIGSNMQAEAKKAVQWVVNYMKTTGNTKKKDDGSVDINIAILEGTTGSGAQVGRTEGWNEEIAKYPNYKTIFRQTGNFTRAEGQQVMEAWMKSPQANDIDILFAQNDDMAIGAIDAINAAGKKPGSDIIIVSIDAVKGAFDAMLRKELNATIECNPLLGPQVMDTAVKILKKQSITWWVESEEGQFDWTNAETAYPTRQY